GGGNLSVAGSLALNFTDVDTSADVRHNPARGPPAIDANGNSVSLTATSNTSSKATASPDEVASLKVGIGGSFALNVATDDAHAVLEDGTLSNVTALTLTATSTPKTTTLAQAGLTSLGVAIGGGIAVGVALGHTEAVVGPGPSTSVGALTLTAHRTSDAETTSDGSAGGP